MIDLGLFVLCGAVIVLAGTALARFGDAIGERTGLGGLWIGSVLLAAATSLPEIATDVSAVRMGAVDLAVGDLFGSSMANMLILALIDILPPRVGVLRRAALDHALSAALALTLNGLAAALVLARPETTVLGVSPGSVLVCAVFVAGTRAVYRHSARARGASETDANRAEDGATSGGASQTPTLRRAIAGFALASAVILLAAPTFAHSAKALADATGLGSTFFGTLVVGLATSLPELVASIAAVRMGAYDLAVGNLFGSNAFNMAIFLALDLAHPGASIFAALSPVHAISALFATVLMSLGLAAIVFRAERRLAMIEPDSLIMIVAYALAMWFIYTRSGAA